MAALLLAGAERADAAPRHRIITYHDGAITLQGYLAYDSTPVRRPAVLVVQDWAGVGPFIEARADAIAALGYVAFAPDIYGKDVHPSGMKAEAAEMAKYTADLPLLRRRMTAGLAQLLADPHADTTHVAAIGYSFGGLAVLELARSGASLTGTVMYYGVPSAPMLSDLGTIKGRVLTLKGGSDPLVSAAASDALQKALTAAKVDWQAVTYGGALHDFANATVAPAPGFAAYDATADHRAWSSVTAFLHEVLR